jgi:alpha-tubulin suppressor-like RCC1 family protein
MRAVGNGSHEAVETPVQVGTGKKWKEVSAGALHTCAIDDSGALYCWGYAFQGALGLSEEFS